MADLQGSRAAGCIAAAIKLNEKVTWIIDNKLLIVELLDTRNNSGQRLWKCICDCGNERILTTYAIKSGRTKSCGCIKKDYYLRPKNNLLNLKFGNLTVIEFCEKNETQHQLIWKCLCDCGQTTFSTTFLLKNGIKQNCGCVAKNNQKQKTKNRQRKTRELAMAEQWKRLEITNPTNTNKKII